MHGCRRLEDLIYRKSGLLGVSGISPDMRTLRASTDPAREAIDLFVYRIIREIGSLTAALCGLMPWCLPVGSARMMRRRVPRLWPDVPGSAQQFTRSEIRRAMAE